MNEQATRIDRILSRIKNNQILALLIVMGMIVIALASFTDAAKTLLGLFTGASSGTDVSGKWTTKTLSNPFDKNDTFNLSFEFEVKGETVFGGIRQTSTTGRYDLIDGILGGEIKDNFISFYTKEQSTTGRETVTYRDLYYGSISDDVIDFTLQSERPWGFPPQKFVAKRQD